MEYAAGGDLFTRVRDHNGMSESEARWFFQQLIIGIDYAHKARHLPRLHSGWPKHADHHMHLQQIMPPPDHL